MDLTTLLTRLNGVPEYRTRFTTAYGAGDITAENIAKAIAAYERTIISANSAFDRYVKGNEQALGNEAKRGLALFVGKANCIACHSGPNFTDDSFHNLGTHDADPGREKIDPGVTNARAFKTPGLRNVALTSPYLHDGSEQSLEAVIRFYIRGGDAPTPDPLVRKLDLTDVEVSDLVAFLGSLTDPVALERSPSP